METQKPAFISNKTMLILGIVSTFILAFTASAFAFGPNDRELSLIEYGMLKQEISDNSAEWLKLEGQQEDLHDANAELRIRLDALDAELFPQNLSYSSQTSSLIISNIYFTSYNPEVGQTDSTPCIAGGTGLNLCDMANEGQRVIALSQELISWSNYGLNAPFDAGDKVILVSTDYPEDQRCNGEFVIADAMNARWRDRGDLFFMNRSDNISCHADIYMVD